MEKRKTLLIIRASHDICGNEMGIISHKASLLGMNVVSKDLESSDQIDEVLSTTVAYDYIYLCSHGNRLGFAVNIDKTKEKEIITWGLFAESICFNKAMAENGVLLLACCRGGMNVIATEMFIGCPEIDFICGPHSNVLPCDITTGFIVFLYSMETKRSEPAYAATKASLATDYTFKCLDREEVETQAGYIARLKEIQEENTYYDSLNDTPIQAPEVINDFMENRKN